MSKKNTPKPTQPAKGAKPAKPVKWEPKPIAENRKARHEYDILETLECGIVLVGSEVKSLRAGKLSLDEAYARVKDQDLFLISADIAEYPQATIFNHKPKRPRKLLVHRTEFRKFAQRAKEKGLTLVPLRFYFNQRGIAKVVLGLCKGRQVHDKRAVMKKSQAQRDISRAMRRER
jgi:SsrA-binding protein